MSHQEWRVYFLERDGDESKWRVDYLSCGHQGLVGRSGEYVRYSDIHIVILGKATEQIKEACATMHKPDAFFFSIMRRNGESLDFEVRRPEERAEIVLAMASASRDDGRKPPEEYCCGELEVPELVQVMIQELGYDPYSNPRESGRSDRRESERSDRRESGRPDRRVSGQSYSREYVGSDRRETGRSVRRESERSRSTRRETGRSDPSESRSMSRDSERSDPRKSQRSSLSKSRNKSTRSDRRESGLSSGRHSAEQNESRSGSSSAGEDEPEEDRPPDAGSRRKSQKKDKKRKKSKKKKKKKRGFLWAQDVETLYWHRMK